MFHFHVAAFMIFSFAFDFWQFNYDVFQHGVLGLYLVWGWLNFLNLKLMSFTSFGKFSVIISSSVSSCSNRFPPPSGILTTQGCPTGPRGSVLFQTPVFSFSVSRKESVCCPIFTVTESPFSRVLSAIEAI